MQAEPLRTTLVHVEIESEAPYAPTVIHDILRELADTLNFTDMYQGRVVVRSPSGEELYSWALGETYEETDEHPDTE